MTIILGGRSGYGRIHLPTRCVAQSWLWSFHIQQAQVELIVLLKTLRHIENLAEKVKERNLALEKTEKREIQSFLDQMQ